MEENKMNINWYPGHMAKTKKQIIEDIKLANIVVELLDARIPVSSQNPDIKEIVKGKPKLIILNKSDLANDAENQNWINYFNKQNTPAILADSVTGKGIQETIKKVQEIYDDEKYINKGRIGKSIRIMVLGIPNVGKSSFINRISKKTSAKVGNKPGVTRQKQWIKVSEKIELLDTPGVLWPKLNNNEVALNLAYTGTIKEDVLEIVEIGFSLLKKLINEYSKNLLERYKINDEEMQNIMQNNNLQENEKILEIMNLIGKKRGAIISGGMIDEQRVANILLEDFRSGKLGKITLEKVSEF